jgi:hypothetical protein
MDLVAEKIGPGEEITYDYGNEHFDGVIRPLGCKCEKCGIKRKELTKRSQRAPRDYFAFG